MYDATIIIPTYKEEETIEQTIDTLEKIIDENKLNFQILIADDNSPDNTISILHILENKYQNLSHFVRTHDRGLSQSIVEAFSKAESDVFIVTDADMSHDITKIPRLYDKINEGFDIVVGSRYMKGGEIKNWPLKRRIISLGATYLARVVFPKITDPVSGFFAVRRHVVENAPLTSKGYKILFEILGKGRWNSIDEIPYTFTNRVFGESKLKKNTIVEYYNQWVDLLKFSFKNRNNKAWYEMEKMVKFGMVGGSGIFVNMGILYALYEFMTIPLYVASPIAIEASVISNFFLNDSWTFRKNVKQSFFDRIFTFHYISFIGMLINILMLLLLTDALSIYYITANIIGIFLAFVWNFFANRSLTWK